MLWISTEKLFALKLSCLGIDLTFATSLSFSLLINCSINKQTNKKTWMNCLYGQRDPEKNPTEIHLYTKILFIVIARQLENIKIQEGNSCRNFYIRNIQPLKECGRTMHAGTCANLERSLGYYQLKSTKLQNITNIMIPFILTFKHSCVC